MVVCACPMLYRHRLPPISHGMPQSLSIYACDEGRYRLLYAPFTYFVSVLNPTLATLTQMFNNYSALCYTAFIEAEVYTCTDSCVAEVRVHYLLHYHIFFSFFLFCFRFFLSR